MVEWVLRALCSCTLGSECAAPPGPAPAHPMPSSYLVVSGPYYTLTMFCPLSARCYIWDPQQSEAFLQILCRLHVPCSQRGSGGFRGATREPWCSRHLYPADLPAPPHVVPWGPHIQQVPSFREAGLWPNRNTPIPTSRPKEARHRWL